MTIQIIISIVIAFIVAKTAARYRKKEISTRLFVFWVLFWLLAALLFWMPELSQYVADLLEVGRGVDAILYISLVILFYFMFKIFNRFERMEREITKLVRETAILNAEKPENSDEQNK